ncbi:hypothetical protein BDL97_19G064400 [Sphagnum fallax]|nr:hypothetical protein BDL97_19G064400 [Sphagnum fallax]
MQPRMRDRKPTATEAAAAARSQIPPRPPRRRAAAAASAASKNGIFSSLNAGGGGGVWMSGNRSKIVAGCVFVAGLLLLLWSWNWSTDKAHGVLTPLHAKPISQLTQFQGKHREQYYWGTYRSTLYLGIRARIPKSILAGFMWLGVKDGQYALRHTCEESDKLSRYAWVCHDGATYGRQEIVDQDLSITTTFLKSWEIGSGYGGDWVVRIQAKKQGSSSSSSSSEIQQEKKLVSLFFYVADEGGNSMKISVDSQHTQVATGSSMPPEVGGWELHAKGQKGAGVSFVGRRRQHMHNLTQLVWQELEMQARTQGRLELPDSFDRSSNIGVVQITGYAPLEVDFVFVTGTNAKDARVNERIENLSGVALSKRLAEQEEKFEQRFESIFQLQSKVQDERQIEVGRVALSNMLGSIGYFYGQSRIAIPLKFRNLKTQNRDYWEYWPAALYTAVPSRSFFPRGFLWDEGFHQLLISQWDRKMSKEIIAHWLDLLNVHGWIPREQILGDEARSKVPDEFVLQHISNANPPTLFMVLDKLVASYKEEKALGKHNEEDELFFKCAFPRLEVWFRWFNTSQIGKVGSSYYWHGRDAETDRELNPKTLMSGLDDYPRASHPTDDERHLDLRCWMALASKSMAAMASIINSSSAIYEATAARLTDLKLLNELHYDEKSGQYLDYGLHSEKVKLQRNKYIDPQTGYIQASVQRVVISPPELGWVPHYGYCSLFPMLMHLLPLDSPAFGTQLDLLRNETHLWTSFGLRSLSTSSSIYMKYNTEHDAPYWRGPIWMNINYLVLSALKHCAEDAVPGKYKEKCSQMYSELRANLIQNVVERYHESGYLWEQYDNTRRGEGKGSHPFTGWTSLILLVMAHRY